MTRTTIDTVLDVAQQCHATELGDRERRAAVDCIVDTVGCALSSAREPVVSRVIEAASPGNMPAFGAGVTTTKNDALLANAAAIRAQDLNDVYSGRNNNHPSESVIPIAVAAAYENSWSGKQLVDAVALGYRLSLTIGDTWSGLLTRGWAPAATLGQISSTAFIALLTGLDPEPTRHAVALSALSSPTLAGVFRGELSDAKSLVSGMAAQNAWVAVDLARAGVTGPRDVLEASGGFNELIGSDPEVPAEIIGADAVWHKAYPAVFSVHAAIDAAVAVAKRVSDRAIGQIHLVAPEKVVNMAAEPSRWTPPTREAAQFSLPYCVATALVFGSCGLDDLEAAMVDPERERVVRLLDMMEVEADTTHAGYSGAQLTVSHAGGADVVVDVRDAVGSPGNPLDSAAIEEKFVAGVARISSESVAHRALAELHTALQAPSIRHALDFLGAGFEREE